MEPATLYGNRQADFHGQADAHRTFRDRLGLARLIVFLLASASVGMALRIGFDEGSGWLMLAVALAVGFVPFVRLQQKAEQKRARAADLARINRDASSRVRRAWPLLPSADYPGRVLPPVARDLGLFGSGSLFQLLGTPRTSAGKQILAGWLLEPAAPEIVRARQAAVRELAPMLDWRQELEREAARTPKSAESIESFCRWAEQNELLSVRSPHVILARALPTLLILLAIGNVVGLIPPVWLGLLFVNGLVWVIGAGRISRGLAGLELRAEALDMFQAPFARVEGQAFESDRLQQLRAELTAGAATASERLDGLHRIARFAEIRYSWLFYLPVQLLFLWDTHVLHRMDLWRVHSGRRVRGWLDVVGEVEALGALGGLWFDNPRWCFAEVERGAAYWQAERLAHPLLPDSERVANDVRLGPPGRFLLVTGSNMSGKSTLLRAVGLGVTLAHAGGPVCAARFTLPPTRLGTSFVIEDSLQMGVSFFLAELQRLRSIVNESSVDERDGWRYLFLLDEILRGTNSGERQIAVRRILSRLLANGASGAISSHDLALADVPHLSERSVAVHFREHYEGNGGAPRMAFDYLLRDGVANTSNALALLEMMGIDGDDLDPASG